MAREMKRPRANSLKDPVRIFTTVESELKTKVFELAADDGRSVQEWLRVELKPLIERKWAERQKRLAKATEPAEIDPAERYAGEGPNVAGEVEGALRVGKEAQ